MLIVPNVTLITERLLDCNEARNMTRILPSSAFHNIHGDEEVRTVIHIPSYILDIILTKMEDQIWPSIKFLLSQSECTNKGCMLETCLPRAAQRG